MVSLQGQARSLNEGGDREEAGRSSVDCGAPESTREEANDGHSGLCGQVELMSATF